jgi:hypothetical protein
MAEFLTFSKVMPDGTPNLVRLPVIVTGNHSSFIKALPTAKKLEVI